MSEASSLLSLQSAMVGAGRRVALRLPGRSELPGRADMSWQLAVDGNHVPSDGVEDAAAADRIRVPSDGVQDHDIALGHGPLPFTVIPLSPQTSDEPWL